MRCLNCNIEIPADAAACPSCRLPLTTLFRDVLPAGALLSHGRYRILGVLGRGGFGVTYEAVHTALEHRVAIKEFFPREFAAREDTTGSLIVATNHQEAFDRGLRRFKREGKLLTTLNHPNIVRALDLFEENGTTYLVMEYLSGPTLWTAMRRTEGVSLPIELVSQVMNGLVSALTTVHGLGIYHLDIKPDNIVLQAPDTHYPEGRIVLIDFGAARQTAGADGPLHSTTIAFTPQYAPPEVMAGKEAGPESDLFELGILLHEMLTGKRPPAAMERLNPSTDGPPWSPTLLGEPWRSLVSAATHLRREERPRSVVAWWTGAQTPPTSEKPQASPATPSQPAAVSVETTPLPLAAHKSDRAGRPWGRMLLLFLIGSSGLGFLVCLGIIVLRRPLTPPEVAVPNLVGKSLTEARQSVAEKLELSVVDEEFRETPPKDAIFRQSLAPGSLVLKGRSVAVWISKGPRMIDVPDVRSLSLTKAQRALEKVGLSVNKITAEYDPLEPAGNVIKQSPESSEQRPRGSKIDLVLSKGEEPPPTPEPKHAGADRTFNVKFPVPKDGASHHIQIDVIDQNGVRTVFDRTVPAGTLVRLDIGGVGSRITIRAYDNDVLISEQVK